MRFWHLSSLLALTLPLAACGPGSQVETGQPTDSAQSSPGGLQPQTQQTNASITASVQSIAQLQERIAAHKGKVVVVDLWALW